MLLKLIMLILFFAVMIAIGFYCRRHATDVNSFVLGGRSVGPWLTAFAYGTSYFSAVIFVGYAGQFGWKYGIASTWIGIGNALIGSMLAWVILGRRTRIMTQHLNSATMPEFFGRRFHNDGLKIGASVIVFLFLIPYTASLYNGLSRLFGMAFHIDYTVCIVIMAVLTGIYVIAGGYMATAINDFLQGIIMLFGIVAVIAAVLNSNGGFLEALNRLALVTDETASVQLAVRSYPDFLRHLGTSADGTEILCHKERKSHKKRNYHIHPVCLGGVRRLLFPRRFRPAVLWQRRDLLPRIRCHYSGHDFQPFPCFDRFGRYTGAVGFHVHSVFLSHGLQFHPYHRLPKGQYH